MNQCPMCGYKDPALTAPKPIHNTMQLYVNQAKPTEELVFNRTEDTFTTEHTIDGKATTKTWVVKHKFKAPAVTANTVTPPDNNTSSTPPTTSTSTGSTVTEAPKKIILP